MGLTNKTLPRLFHNATHLKVTLIARNPLESVVREQDLHRSTRCLRKIDRVENNKMNDNFISVELS